MIPNLLKLQKVKKNERPGKEIKIKTELCKNKNLTAKLGTLDDKNSPETVYLSLTFWVDIKEKDCFDENYDYIISKKFKRELKKIYNNNLSEILKDNKYFPLPLENIYIYDFPNNLNYNNKKSFVSIELNLHTINCVSNEKYSLKNNSKNELFNELIKIYKLIETSDLLLGKKDFNIYKSKK